MLLFCLPNTFVKHSAPALVSNEGPGCIENTVKAEICLFYPPPPPPPPCRIIDSNAGVNGGGVGAEPPCPPDWLAAFARALIFHCNRQCNILSCQSDSPPLETVQDSNHINHPSTSTVTTTTHISSESPCIRQTRFYA